MASDAAKQAQIKKLARAYRKAKKVDRTDEVKKKLRRKLKRAERGW